MQGILMRAASCGCWAAAQMSSGPAARLCMLRRWNIACSSTPIYWQRLWWGCRTPTSANRWGRALVSCHHMFSYTLYGGEVGPQTADGTRMCTHTGHGAGASARAGCCRSATQWQSELQAFCRQRGLSRFKVPGHIWCQTAPLPVNNSGKIVKPEVKALLSQALMRHSAVSKL